MQSHASCCPICYNEFDQFQYIPRIIPTCGHTFCSGCLDSLLKNNETKCPLDKTVFSGANAHVHDFPINFALKQLIEERFGLEICPQHKEEVRMVCITDKVKICDECLYLEHNGHKIKPMKAVRVEADTKRKELEMILEKLDTYNKEITGVLEEKKAYLLRVIRDRFAQLKWLIEKQETEMTFEVTSLFNAKRNKMNKVFGVSSDLRKNIMKKIADLKDIQKSDNLFGALEEDLSKIVSKVNQVLVEKDTGNLREELRHISNPVESFFNSHIELISRVRLSQELAKEIDRFYPFDYGKNGHEDTSFIHSMAQSLFNIESQDDVIVISSKNIYSESKNAMKSSFPGSSEWAKASNVYLRLCETDSPEEYVQTLFYIWRNLAKITSLKIEFIPDYIYFGEYNMDSSVTFDNYLVNLFPAIFWKTIDLQRVEISLRNCRFGDEGIILLSKEVLSKAYGLRSLILKLSATEVTNKSIEVFGKSALSSLRHLENFEIDLSKTAVTSAGATQLFMNMENLKRFVLRLGSTKIDNNCLKVFSQKMSLTLEGLEHFELDLGNTSINDEGVSMTFAKCLNLKSYLLSLNDTKITDKALELLTENALAHMHHLETFGVNLSNTLTGDTGITRIFKCLPNVRNLGFYLDNTAITDETLKVFVECIGSNMGSLESLKLSFKGTNIKDTGACQLFGNMSLIRDFLLNLGENNISDIALKTFVKNTLNTMEVLESLELYLYETHTTDDSLVELFNCIKNVKRLVLDVRSTKITDKSIQVFLKTTLPRMTCLEDLELNVAQTKVTTECAAQIEQIKEKFFR